ncbi:efflux RND transporter periplasmic adaptor subunit [Pedobacter aquatilis]|uniref:efflux RND transporter periplasmic adaptor subunit n=1 Tax=Pedobacter aquatilis TaxID=351343 RepID=UPI0025B3B66A|nr:efflux RND transporter periplasmic adaptor subunit [Pedobacter aquatilis]MDN3588878.1 efflux RND transporter periplasmic adaptor subunit [Pedobacter aquatilis]
MKFKKYMVILAICATYACTSEPVKEEEKKPISEDEVSLAAAQFANIKLQVAEPKWGETSEVLKLQGKIDVPPQNLISISVPLGGYLKHTKLLPGMHVAKGQVIAIMEDPQYIQLQQDFLSITNKLYYAEKELTRQKELNVNKANSDKTLQGAEIEYKNLKVEHSALLEKLKLINISGNTLKNGKISKSINLYSPIDGYVSKVNVNIGKYVTPSDVLFELINPTDIHLNLTVFEKDLSKISMGQSVITFNNVKPDVKYEAEVILIGHNVEEGGSSEVHCHFEKYDKSLVPGMYMNAELKFKNQKVQLLPEESVVSFENKDFVFEQLSKEKYKMIAVTTGEASDGNISIHTDLTGKKIVSKGAYSLLMKLKNTSDEE